MPNYLVPPGIRFNDCMFTEPAQLAAWRPPGCAGIVAILARNPHWSPKPFQPLCFGEFGNDAGRGASLPTLSDNTRWEDLLVSVLPMPYSTVTQRRTLCNELIAAYNPACQTGRTIASTGGLERKVDELQARQQEQSQQILYFLAHIGKLFEPQPVGPRRPIGFLPQLDIAGAQPTESGS